MLILLGFGIYRLRTSGKPAAAETGGAEEETLESTEPETEAPTEPTLSPEEEAEVIKLQTEKYRNWDWTYGKSPAYALHTAARFPGGRLEVKADVQNGVIQDIRFIGDFLALMEIDPAQDELKGVRFERENVRKALEPLPIEQIFGAVTLEDILTLLFEV